MVSKNSSSFLHPPNTISTHPFVPLLIQASRNRYWNVDVFGILRGHYLSPAFAIRVGSKAIRNCFRDTLIAMRKEGLDNMGEHPCMFSEIGIPYDMEDGKAYETGDYTSQMLAMDANFFALEAGGHNFTWWTYTASVSSTRQSCFAITSISLFLIHPAQRPV